MPLDALFSFANLAVLPGWLMIAVAPRWRWSQRYAALLVPLLLGAVYAWLLVTNWGSGGGFGTLDAVAQLFQNRAVLLGGWIHYLILDLFTGAWESRDAISHGIPRWAVAPCLLLTFLLGPIGLGLYLLIRVAWRRHLDPYEAH